jgi:hypothetical protein
MAWAAERGFTRLGLSAPWHRPEARALYRRAGFLETGDRRRMSGRPELEVVEMVRAL